MHRSDLWVLAGYTNQSSLSFIFAAYGFKSVSCPEIVVEGMRVEIPPISSMSKWHPASTNWH